MESKIFRIKQLCDQKPCDPLDKTTVQEALNFTYNAGHFEVEELPADKISLADLYANEVYRGELEEKDKEIDRLWNTLRECSYLLQWWMRPNDFGYSLDFLKRKSPEIVKQIEDVGK